MIAGAGLVGSKYCGIDLGVGGVGGSSCALRSPFHARRLSSGGDFFNSLSIGDNQFPLKAAAARYINAAAATGNGAFTGGSRGAEDVNEALAKIVPPMSLDHDSATFRAILAAIASVAVAAERQRRHELLSPKTEVPIDALRQGRLVESKLVYRQTFVIRSYEIGADRTASIETMMNHFQVTTHILSSLSRAFAVLVKFARHLRRDVCLYWFADVVQETALNHVWMSGLAGDGFGATRAMSCRNLIWVVTRMQVHVEQYPAWYATDRDGLSRLSIGFWNDSFVL